MKYFRKMLFLGLFSAASVAHSDQLPTEAEVFGNLNGISTERLSEQQLSTTHGEAIPLLPVVWVAIKRTAVTLGLFWAGNEVTRRLNDQGPAPVTLRVMDRARSVGTEFAGGVSGSSPMYHAGLVSPAFANSYGHTFVSAPVYSSRFGGSRRMQRTRTTITEL